MKIKIRFLDDIRPLINHTSAIVGQLEKKDSEIASTIRQWFCEIEAVLQDHHRQESGQIAALRAQLLSLERGCWKSQDFSWDEKAAKRHTRKSIIQSSAGIIIHNAHRILSDIISPMQKELDEAQSTLKQILLLALQKGTLEGKQLTPHFRDLKAIWQRLMQDEELKLGCQKTLTLVTLGEALYLLEDVIVSWEKDSKEGPYQRRSVIRAL